MPILLKGKDIGDKINALLKHEVASFKDKPKLVSIQINDNAASHVYIANQKKHAEALGIKYEIIVLSDDVSETQAVRFIHDLNANDDITAFILQLPLPDQLDRKVLVSAMDPLKDAESMHPENMGKIILGKYSIGPCTAMAVMELIKSTGVELRGKNAVCVGHSDIIGKPLSLMLLDHHVTTTVCHVATAERGLLPKYVGEAEILIVAVGKPGVIKGEWIRKGAVVIDVGINRIDGKIVGDVEFEKASQAASYITPVPGGVGPLTTSILMRNVVELYKLKHRG